MAKIVVVCSIRALPTPEHTTEVQTYITGLRAAGHEVFSYWDTEMGECPTGAGILFPHLEAIRACDAVHLFWDDASRGSHFELGTAVALWKPLVFLRLYAGLPAGQSYVKALLAEYPQCELACPPEDLQGGG